MEAADVTSSSSEAREPAPRRALVVENDLASRELLARVLRGRGLDAQTAVGAAQAAAVLLDAPWAYDLLVVDLNLEPVDGVELLRHVAAMPAGRRPGKVIVIGDALGPFYPRLKALGMPVEAFVKPVHLPSLMRVVEGDGPGAETRNQKSESSPNDE